MHTGTHMIFKEQDMKQKNHSETPTTHQSRQYIPSIELKNNEHLTEVTCKIYRKWVRVWKELIDGGRRKEGLDRFRCRKGIGKRSKDESVRVGVD